ncbi:hypothetical protein B0I35DRAFT_414600 [Stachybotrys elegans]|uniref:Uncharacterized protein n=1 Tax=Stachybotrys elegans TaxID=80388 RepID=A0A8K0S9Y3_9HYPO|nr:hypothetical protein B0I35DRAFT_414600 [Stachybotrys elegans]
MRASFITTLFAAVAAAAPTLTPDWPTADGRPGIGVEFETLFRFEDRAKKCPRRKSDLLKKSLIDNRQGRNFKFTVDTVEEEFKLAPEYILDGTKIKVGSGDAARAGKDAAADFMEWSPQVTAPMPLEALYALMKDHKLSIANNVLVGFGRFSFGTRALVPKDAFRTSPNGISRTAASDDVLAFASLVLSYAKGSLFTTSRNPENRVLDPGSSMKLTTDFMPRTDFNGLYDQVKAKIPGNLFSLMEILACYKLEPSRQDRNKLAIFFDTTFCTGTTAAPVPNGRLATIELSVPGGPTLRIKDWIDGIGAGKGFALSGNTIRESRGGKDMLSALDEAIDGSIGGLKRATEEVLGTARRVPLFEFRQLDSVFTSQWENFMQRADNAVAKLHRDFANAPRKRSMVPIPASCFPKTPATPNRPANPPSRPAAPPTRPAAPPSRPATRPGRPAAPPADPRRPGRPRA